MSKKKFTFWNLFSEMVKTDGLALALLKLPLAAIFYFAAKENSKDLEKKD